MIAIGVLDLVASGIGGGPPRRSGLAWLAAIATAAAAAGLAHWELRPCIAVSLVVALASPFWLLARRAGKPKLLLALLTLIAGAWLAARVGENENGSDAAVIVGSFIFLVAPANALVRLALEAAGLQVDREEDRMRGGRLIGAVERWLILVLAWAGDLTAAGLVIAARSILRFPELAAARRESAEAEAAESKPGRRGDDPTEEAAPPAAGRIRRVDPTTEYFLLGSMTSWLIAAAVAVFLTQD
jgi:hypothetical protein